MSEFRVGDFISITDDDSNVKEWRGFVGEVVGEDDGDGYVKIKPPKERPDGMGLDWFYWEVSYITRVCKGCLDKGCPTLMEKV